MQPTDYDEGIFEMLDEDQREEEMALMGRVVNPPGVDYDCVTWSPVSDSDLVQTMGWHPGLSIRQLTAADFVCTAIRVSDALQESRKA